MVGNGKRKKRHEKKRGIKMMRRGGRYGKRQ